MKKSKLINNLLLRYEEVIEGVNNEFLNSKEFKVRLKSSKTLNSRKSKKGISLDYVHDWSSMKAFPTFIVYLKNIEENKAQISISFPKYFLWFYLFGYLSIVIGFLIDLMSGSKVDGDISGMPIVLIGFPILTYVGLLFAFSLLIDSCIRDLKKILV